MTTMFDFGDGNGPVPAHHHKNPDGSIGGWVADTATVEPTVFVGPDARIFGRAVVRDKVRIEGKARVSGGADIVNNARIYGDAEVGGHVLICDRACVRGGARVDEDAIIQHDADVSGDAHIAGWAVISGNAHIKKGVHRVPPLHCHIGEWTVTLNTRDLLIIGCQEHSLAHWHEHLDEIANEYWATKQEVRMVRAFLDLCKARLGDSEASFW